MPASHKNASDVSGCSQTSLTRKDSLYFPARTLHSVPHLSFLLLLQHLKQKLFENSVSYSPNPGSGPPPTSSFSYVPSSNFYPIYQCLHPEPLLMSFHSKFNNLPKSPVLPIIWSPTPCGLTVVFLWPGRQNKLPLCFPTLYQSRPNKQPICCIFVLPLPSGTLEWK